MAKKKNQSTAREREEAERQRMLDREMADRQQAMGQDVALAALLTMVYFVRGAEFDALGQILGLVISWLVGLLVMDVYFLLRRLPRPAHWIRRIGPAAGIGIVVFLLAFVLPN